MKAACRALAAVLAAALVMAVGVQFVARAAWTLGGPGNTSLEELRREEPLFHRWTAEELANVRIHRVAEWPADKPRIFHEAPELAERVARGELPPVHQRVGEEPLVVAPPDQCGPYGGTWVQYETETTRYVPARIGYEEPLRWDPWGRETILNLFKRVETTDDGRTWMLHMRRGVRWSDGAPFTADDYVFWYEDLLLDPNITPVLSETYRLGGQPFKLEKVDEYTIRMRFAVPNGQLLAHLAMGGYRPMPAHYVKRYHPDYVPSDEMNRMVREHNLAGPYQLLDLKKNYWANELLPRLEAWISEKLSTPGEPTTFVRNPYYWKVDPQGNQLPYIDRLVFNVVSDRQTLNLKAINGQISMRARLDLINYPLLAAKSRQSHLPGSHVEPFRVLHWLGPDSPRLYPNVNHHDPVKNALLNDKRFHQALSLAINRHEINEVQFLGMGQPRQNCPTSRSPFYSADFEKAYVQYDPARANALLDELGLTRRNAEGIRLRADGKPLVLDIDACDMTGYFDALELVTQHWREAGIQSDLRIQSRYLWRERYWAGMQDVYAWWFVAQEIPLAEEPVPTDRWSPLARLWGLWYQTDGQRGLEPSPDMRRAMELWRQVIRTPDRPEQIRLFQEIFAIQAENVWEIGLVGEAPIVVVVQDRFRNVPQAAYYDWYSRGPANTAPECYAIEPE